MLIKKIQEMIEEIESLCSMNTEIAIKSSSLLNNFSSRLKSLCGKGKNSVIIKGLYVSLFEELYLELMICNLQTKLKLGLIFEKQGTKKISDLQSKLEFLQESYVSMNIQTFEKFLDLCLKKNKEDIFESPLFKEWCSRLEKLWIIKKKDLILPNLFKFQIDELYLELKLMELDFFCFKDESYTKELASLTLDLDLLKINHTFNQGLMTSTELDFQVLQLNIKFNQCIMTPSDFNVYVKQLKIPMPLDTNLYSFEIFNNIVFKTDNISEEFEKLLSVLQQAYYWRKNPVEIYDFLSRLMIIGDEVLNSNSKLKKKCEKLNRDLIKACFEIIFFENKILFNQITAKDLQATGETFDAKHSPNIFNITDYSEKLASYVRDDIVSDPDNLPIVINKWSFWIEVAYGLLKAGDLNGFQSVVSSGFMKAEIYRLNMIKKMLPRGCQFKLKLMEKFFFENKNLQGRLQKEKRKDNGNYYPLTQTLRTKLAKLKEQVKTINEKNSLKNEKIIFSREEKENLEIISVDEKKENYNIIICNEKVENKKVIMDMEEFKQSIYEVIEELEQSINFEEKKAKIADLEPYQILVKQIKNLQHKKFQVHFDPSGYVCNDFQEMIYNRIQLTPTKLMELSLQIQPRPPKNKSSKATSNNKLFTGLDFFFIKKPKINLCDEKLITNEKKEGNNLIITNEKKEDNVLIIANEKKVDNNLIITNDKKEDNNIIITNKKDDESIKDDKNIIVDNDTQLRKKGYRKYTLPVNYTKKPAKAHRNSFPSGISMFEKKKESLEKLLRNYSSTDVKNTLK